MKRAIQYSGIVLLLFLCSIQMGNAQPDTKRYSDSVISTFSKVKGEKRIQRIADFIRNANFQATDHERFKPFLKEAYTWQKKHPNPHLLNTIRLGHVNMLIAGHDNPKAARRLQEILNSGEPLSTRDSISTYTFLHGIYTSINAYSEAWKILRIRDQVMANVPADDPQYQQYQKTIRGDLPLLYLVTKNYEKAEKGFKEQIAYAKTVDDPHLVSGAYNNLGLCYLKKNDPDNAIASFNQAQNYWDIFLSNIEHISTSDSTYIDIVNGNIASALNQKEEYAKAIPLLLKEIETDIKINVYSYAINALNELSVSYVGLKQYDKAKQVLDRAKKMSYDHPSPSGIRDNHKQRIQLLEAIGKANEALQLYKLLTAFNDSMLTVENNSQTAVMQAVYSVEEKDRELSKEKIRTAEAKAETERQRGVTQTLVIGSGLMLLILTILILNAGQRRKRTALLKLKNAQIEEQKMTIEKALIEKDTLLKEIHHRVKNNLQLISGILELQAVKFDDKNVKIVMEEGQSRVKSMALIHEQLYQSEDLGKIDFEEYLVKLVNDIAIAFNNENLKLETKINVNHLSFDVNVAVPLGLIINELVTNALQHGFAGKTQGEISIKLEAESSEHYSLTVCDDGNGLPENFNPEEINSLGLRLVKGLSRQLGGNYKYSNDSGTKFIIQFKTHNTH